MDDAEFDKVMGMNKQGARKKQKVIDTVKEKFQKRQKQKNNFKNKGGKGGGNRGKERSRDGKPKNRN